MDWDALDTALLDAEIAGGTAFRICRVWHPAPARKHWHGLYGGAPVEVGPISYQTSDGTIVKL